ncbi:MAG: glycosyltransferase family 4 protein [Candidatus Krumholzibacteria bacterium]|nr:glycosyltransferase family 4 protein [Candidatus Krumholzibacteria bacterium]
MKIAILGIKGVPGHHGVEVVVDSLLPHLSALGHEITVYGYSSYCEASTDYNGALVVPVKGSACKNIEMFSHMWHSSIDTRRHDYDIVHIHSADPCILARIPRARYGIVATSHGQAYIRKKWSAAARSMSKLAERFFIRVPRIKTSVSKPLADYYNSKYGAGVRYIPNGIVFRDKPPVSLLEKWGLEEGGYLFCSAGRIEKTKGLSTLVEAYGKLDPGIPLIVAGGGSATDESYFEELKKNSPDGVRFVGFLTGDEFFALYAHAKVFVFPSEYEAMSMALLEGLSFGTPTVFSDIPENRAVADGIGFAFQVSDADSLVKQLDFVLSHPEEAAAAGERAAAHVRAEHSWEADARLYDDVYKEMAGHDRKTI